MAALLERLRQSRPFALIAGVNVLENYPLTLQVARALQSTAHDLGIEFVFKASFDKANRSNGEAFRGPGLNKGLAQLSRLKEEVEGIRIVADVHEPFQCIHVKAAGLDMVQIPAFLCRQTDLVHAAADTGLPLLLKKGQFATNGVMHAAVQKAASRPAFAGAIICERGTCVGPDQLVLDVRNLIKLRSDKALVALDATHAAQIPAQRVGEGLGSGGERFAVEAIARAGVAVGVDCLFMEVHPTPAIAPVDSNVQWPLDDFQRLLKELVAIANASSWRSPIFTPM